MVELMNRDWGRTKPLHPLVFLHLPKTAGATLRQILLRQYGRRYSFALDGSTSQLQEFIEKPFHERARLKLLQGHMAFGMHRYLSEGATYVTFVRDPAERVLSHYRFALGRPDHYLHNHVKAERLTPADYVASGVSTELDNGQVRLIAGPASLDVPFGDCGRDLLDLALENIRRHFSVVGMPSFFDESLLLMHRRLRWRKWPCYASLNVSGGGGITLSDSDRSVIETYNQLDRRLYEVIKDRLTGEIADEGNEFETALSRFRRVNRSWSKLMWPAFQMRTLNRRRLSLRRDRGDFP